MKKLILFLALVFIGSTVFASNDPDIDDVGVLVLAHGGDSLWNATIENAVAPLKDDYTVQVAFGMANPTSMQKGIDILEEKGVKNIVVIQLFVSSYSMIIRQNEYLLGFRDTLADPPLLMMHGHGGGHGHGQGGHHGMKEKDQSAHHEMKKESHGHHMMMENNKDIDLPQLNIKAHVLLAKPLNDDPHVVNILIDRIKELSKHPEKETVILVAHGPNDKMDNMMWMNTLHNISTQVQSAFGVDNFKKVTYLTLRDDASEHIYNAAKQHFRNVVKKANLDNGSALIVPVLMSNGGIEDRLEKRLHGLDYVWTSHTLLPDERITDFIESSVEEALEHREEALD